MILALNVSILLECILYFHSITIMKNVQFSMNLNFWPQAISVLSTPIQRRLTGKSLSFRSLIFSIVFHARVNNLIGFIVLGSTYSIEQKLIMKQGNGGNPPLKGNRQRVAKGLYLMGI